MSLQSSKFVQVLERHKPLVWGIGKYALGFLLLGLVIWQNWRPADGGGIADAISRPMHVTPLIIATALYLFAILFTFVRWYVLVRAQDLPFTVWNAMRLGLIGFFLSTFLPGSIGGDVFKAAYLAKEQSRRTVAVATVLIDRAIGLWGLFGLVAVLGSVFWFADDSSLETPKLQYLVIGSVAVVVSSIATWLLMGLLPEWRAQRFAGRLERLPKVGHSAAEFWRAIWMYRLKGKSIALALGMAMVGHVGFVLAFYYAARVYFGVGTDEPIPSLAEHFLIVPVGMTVTAVAPLPGGLGIGEFGYAKLYELVLGTAAAPRGVLASLVARLISIALGMVGYLVYLRMKPSLANGTEAPTEGTEQRNGTPAGATFGGDARDLPASVAKTP